MCGREGFIFSQFPKTKASLPPGAGKQLEWFGDCTFCCVCTDNKHTSCAGSFGPCSTRDDVIVEMEAVGHVFPDVTAGSRAAAAPAPTVRNPFAVDEDVPEARAVSVPLKSRTRRRKDGTTARTDLAAVGAAGREYRARSEYRTGGGGGVRTTGRNGARTTTVRTAK